MSTLVWSHILEECSFISCYCELWVWGLGFKVPFGNFIDLCNFCSVPHFLRSAHQVLLWTMSSFWEFCQTLWVHPLGNVIGYFMWIHVVFIGSHIFQECFFWCYLNYKFILFRTGDIKDTQQPLFDAKSGWQHLADHQHIQSPSINHQDSFQYWISTITFRWLILSFFLEVLGSKLVWVCKICKTRNLKILYKFYTSIAYQRWKKKSQ